MSKKRENRLDINASGYVDPTAGRALEAVSHSLGRPKRGDIWTAYFGNAERRLAILAVNDLVCSVVVLNDESRGPKDRPTVTEKGQLGYYIPSMLSYKFVADLDERVDSLDAEQLGEVLHECAKALGLTISAPEPAPAPAPQPEPVKVETPSQTETELREEIIRLTAARDLYREEYWELLARLTGKE